MQPRKDHGQVEIKGSFPGADVVRGVDWGHEDKDGKRLHYGLNCCKKSRDAYH